MKKRIEIFKDELKHLNDYMDEALRLETELELLEYDMANVRGIDYSKQSGTYNETAAQQKFLAMSEKKEKIEKEIKRNEEKIHSIAEVLQYMDQDERTLLIEVIADRRTYREVCMERNIKNTSTLFSMINGIIEAALKKKA